MAHNVYPNSTLITEVSMIKCTTVARILYNSLLGKQDIIIVMSTHQMIGVNKCTICIFTNTTRVPNKQIAQGSGYKVMSIHSPMGEQQWHYNYRQRLLTI